MQGQFIGPTPKCAEVTMALVTTGLDIENSISHFRFLDKFLLSCKCDHSPLPTNLPLHKDGNFFPVLKYQILIVFIWVMCSSPKQSLLQGKRTIILSLWQVEQVPWRKVCPKFLSTNKFSKVSRYKINIQKLVVIPCTNNKLSER